MSQPALLVQIKGVDKMFHRGSEDISVLRDLNLDVPAGQFLFFPDAGGGF